MRSLILNTLIGFGVLFLAGCSSSPIDINQDPDTIIEVVDPEACLNRIVGKTTIRDWCEADLGKDSDECSCTNPNMINQIPLFEAFVKNNMGAADLSEWRGVLPEESSLERVFSIATGPIPFGTIGEWIELKQSDEDMFEFYNTGLVIDQVRIMISLGLTPEDVSNWISTKIPFEHWAEWINGGMSYKTAAEINSIHELSSKEAIKRYLIARKFIPLQPVFATTNEWICSKTNYMARIKSITKTEVRYLIRYRAVDREGYDLPELTIFDDGFDLNEIAITRHVARGVGDVAKWSSCPVKVVNHVSNR